MTKLHKILLSSLLAASCINASAQENIKFAFITDLHVSLGSHSQKDLSLVIDDINRNRDQYDFVMVGGDITDFGTDEELAAAKKSLDSLQLPYRVIAGNHDAKWSESGCNTFLKVFGYEQFEFDCKGWRFLGCNSGPDMRMAPALVPVQSIHWLDKLGENPRKSIFINHYPMDSSVLNYPDVIRAIRRADVRMEIGGHWHRNTVLDYDGVPGILGRSTMSTKSCTAGYTIIDIDANDRLTACERRVTDHSAVTLPAWYSRDLVKLNRTVPDGLPESYPWLRYDVNETYSNVKEVWRIDEDANCAAGMAVDETRRRVWYCLEDGTIKCVSLKDGRQKWSTKLPGKVFSTPALDGGMLVTGCTDGSIWGLQAGNGQAVWKVKAGKSVLGSPAILDGVAYIGASDGVFRAIDTKTGAIKWQNDSIIGFVECKPYVDAQQVVFGTWGNRLYSLDTATGRIQWTWNTGKSSRMYSPAACWPVKTGGKIYVTCPDRKLYAIDAATGAKTGEWKGGRESIGLSRDGRYIEVKTMYSSAYSLDTYTGKERWNVRTPLGYDISPTTVTEWNGVLVIPTDKGNIVALNPATGELEWMHKISMALVNPVSPVMLSGKKFLLASTMDGVITLLPAE